MAAKTRDVMTVTEAAAARVREILANHPDALGLRIGIKNAGCAGMSYTLDLAQEVRPGEERVEAHGVSVFIEAKALLFLLGTEMDFEKTVLKTGFVFRNPNEVSACGCGESVSLKPAEGPILSAG